MLFSRMAYTNGACNLSFDTQRGVRSMSHTQDARFPSCHRIVPNQDSTLRFFWIETSARTER